MPERKSFSTRLELFSFCWKYVLGWEAQAGFCLLWQCQLSTAAHFRTEKTNQSSKHWRNRPGCCQQNLRKKCKNIIKLKNTEKYAGTKHFLQITNIVIIPYFFKDLHVFRCERLQLHQSSTSSEEFHPHNSTQCKQPQICEGCITATIDQITTSTHTLLSSTLDYTKQIVCCFNMNILTCVSTSIY